MPDQPFYERFATNMKPIEANKTKVVEKTFHYLLTGWTENDIISGFSSIGIQKEHAESYITAAKQLMTGLNVQHNNLTTLRILWGAYVVAVFIFNIIARVIVQESGEAAYPLLVQIFIGLSVVELIAVLVIQVKIGNSLPADTTSIFVPKLLQFALAESVAIYGLVLTFMDGSTQRLIYFSVAAIAGLLIAYPRR